MLHCGPWGQGELGGSTVDCCGIHGSTSPICDPMAVDGMDWRHLGDLLGMSGESKGFVL